MNSKTKRSPIVRDTDLVVPVVFTLLALFALCAPGCNSSPPATTDIPDISEDFLLSEEPEPEPECPDYYHYEQDSCVADPMPYIPPRFHTRDGFIFDARGRKCIFNGVNLSNDVKYPPYESWTQEEDYARLQDWGMSVIRMLTSWVATMPEEGVINNSYLEELDQRVEWARQYNLYVIIDMHQDIWGEGFGGNGAPRWSCDEELYAAHVPRTPWYTNYGSPQLAECYDRFWNDASLQDLYIDAFVATAARYADKEHVIGFDLYNEPFWGTANLDTFHRDILQHFYERLMDRLNEVAPDKLFFIQPAITAQAGLEPAFEIFPEDREVIYSVHYYDYGVHDQHEFDGDTGGLIRALGNYSRTAERLNNIPWMLGEWGGFTDSVNFDLYLRAILSVLEDKQTGHSYWEYSPLSGFSLLNPDKTEKTEIINILSRVYPKISGGELIDYSFDDITGVFTITLKTIPWLDAETILAFPADRHYPHGFELESTDPEGSWSYEVNRDLTELAFTIDNHQEFHTLTIRPR